MQRCLIENLNSYVLAPVTPLIGPLQLKVTWYKIQNIGEQKNVTGLHWEI